MHAEAIDESRHAVRRRQEAVPDVFGALGQRNALQLALTVRIEQAQLDFAAPLE